MPFRRYARIAKLIALLGFWLPWMTVSCSQQPIARLSGINLALGSAVVRDPISGAVTAHSGVPVLAISVALLLLVIGLFSSLVFAKRRAADFDVFYSAAALALIFYATIISDWASTYRGNFLESMMAGSIKVETAFGLWITCLALSASIFLNHKLSAVLDNLSPPSWRRRAFGIAGIVCVVIATPALMGGDDASANPGSSRAPAPSSSSRASATTVEYTQSHSKLPILSIEPLEESDTSDMEQGASCWATNALNKTVFASTGPAVIRVGGVKVDLVEMPGRIGGNTLHSLDHTITVVFEERPGEDIYFEEGVSKPMKMTILNGDDKTSISVMRSCGA